MKPTFLAQQGDEVINPMMPDEDFAEAVRIAQAEFDRYRPDVIVGTSRGGAVAMNIQSGDTPLVLLCAALEATRQCQDSEAGDGDPSFKTRPRDPFCRQRGTGQDQRPARFSYN